MKQTATSSRSGFNVKEILEEDGGESEYDDDDEQEDGKPVDKNEIRRKFTAMLESYSDAVKDFLYKKFTKERVERWFATIALHYLAFELLFKSVTVIATTQVTVIASSLLLTNYFTAASIIYIVQPWKAVDQGGSIFRLPNALNRMESSNMLLQSLLIVVPVI